ncbi:hypothetical protein M2140_001025 [Clostridiales Family XIII bacterium PM5-7]
MNMVYYTKYGKGDEYMKITPWQKEWNTLVKQEQAFLRKGENKKSSLINKALEGKVPESLESTLNTAFAKAFSLVFDKGTGIIEKTYRKEDLEHDYKVNTYSVDLKENRKTLGLFSKKANNASAKNLLLSGVEGIGLGALGIGLPDIPVYVGVMLKSIYEVALHFGYPYDTEEEKLFILRLIQTAFSYGDELKESDEQINDFIEHGHLPEDFDEQAEIRSAAVSLSTELLYLKFLQGLPIVGMVGGAYNTVYLQKVLSYAKLKYKRRFLLDRNRPNNPDIA